MKLQLLELPMEHVGDITRTPFALVLSETEGETIPFGLREEARIELGAVGVLVFGGEVEIG